MDRIKNLFAPANTIPAAPTGTGVPQVSSPPLNVTSTMLPSNNNAASQQDGSAMDRAQDLVNQTKAAYDDCETRRMQEVMNGRGSEEFSCEREFKAFKDAFDHQLVLESKVVLGSGTAKKN